METKSVKQYNLRLELPSHTTVEVVGDDLNVVKETAQGILKGVCRFEAISPPGNPTPTLGVFHPTFDSGRTPVGWIATWEVPESMSVGAIIERRLQAA